MPDSAVVPDKPASAADSPWRNANVTAGCQHCGDPLPAGRARRFCSNRCRQAAHRRRGRAARPAAAVPPAGRSRTEIGVYECPSCGERLAGQRRCPDCGLFARRLGDGRACISCGEVITITELLDPT